jgi:outer membrane protein TolC
MTRGGDDGGAPAQAARAAGAAVILALACWSAPAAAQGAAAAPLTLEQCKALAAAKTVEVRRAEAEVGSAEQTQSAARTAYAPQVSAAAGAFAANSPLVNVALPGGMLPVIGPAGPTGEGAYFPGTSAQVGKHGNVAALTAIQPVFAGGRIVNGNRLADVGVRAAKEKEAMARRDARLEAEERYWQIVALAEKDRTLRAYQDTLAALEKEIQDALDSGLATKNDLLKVRLERGKAEVQRLELESGRRLAARDLRRFLGMPDGDELVLADAAPPEPARPDAERARERAPERRLEIKLLESAVEAERLQSRIKLGQALPTVSIGAQAFRYDLSGASARDEGIVFALLTVPLTDVWKGAHETAAAREKERAAQLRLDDTRRLVAEEASKAWDELDAAWSATQVADAGVEQASVNLTEKKDGYASGLEKSSDLLEAQTLAHQASDRRIDARIAFALKRAAYLRAIAAE